MPVELSSDQPVIHGDSAVPTMEAQHTEPVSLETIQEYLKTLNLKVDRIEQKQERLDTQICGNGGLQESLKNVASDTGENSGLLATHIRHCENLQTDIHMLKSLVLKQHNKLRL